MKKYLFLSLFLVLAAAFIGCEAVYDDAPAPMVAPPAPVPQQPQAPPFIVLEDPDWENNQQAPMGYNVPGQPMMYPGQQPMMAAPGQIMMAPQGQPMMAAPGQPMVYPGQQPMMYPGQQPMMMEGDSPEPPGTIYEVPGGPGQPPVIYPQGTYMPQDGMAPQDMMEEQGDAEFTS